MKNLTLIIAFSSTVLFGNMYAQEQINEKTIPTNAVKIAFEKDFPKETAQWSQDYGGEDLDQIRYIAIFKSDNTKGLAVYYATGTLIACEVLINNKDIPTAAINYLNANYKDYSITEATKVKDENNINTYEIGIIRDRLFYDCVFDKTGGFLKIVEKD